MFVRTGPNTVKHLRAAVVIVASIGIAAGLAAAGLARWGVAAGVGAALVTLGVALVRGHGPRRAAGAGAVAGLAGVLLHVFFAESLGAGLPEVRAVASGIGLAPGVTAVVAFWAWWDHPRR